MFAIPLRLLNGLRTSVAPGVLIAIAVSTVVFSATPFLVPAIASEEHVGVGRVGLMSTVQLIGFVAASWGVPRLMHPRRRAMVVAALLGVVANLASAFAPSFELLLASRLFSGLSLGLIAWIAWAQAFGDNERVGDVAVIGPIVGTIVSPLLGWIVAGWGSRTLFVVLAVLNLVPLAFIRSTRLNKVERPVTERHRATTAAVVILAALALLTLGGSAVFVFAGSIGLGIDGLSPLMVSLAFSANALAGIPSARFRGVRALPGAWIMMIGAAALVLLLWHQPIPFVIALMMWGFAYWMAVPGAYALLAKRSRYPDERAGDAQAVMAIGRVVGPLIGGLLYDTSLPALAAFAGALFAAAGVILLYVEWRIEPVDPRQIVRRITPASSSPNAT